MATKKRVAKKVENLSPIRVGESVYIRTVTYHYTGRIVQLSGMEIVLEDAAWIADSGRFTQAMSTGSISEVEPYPDGVRVSVSRGACVDVATWRHALPRTQK